MDELSLTIFDIVENSIRANATLIEVIIKEDIKKNKLFIEIIDNGIGMDSEELKKAIDPFYTTKKVRKVGIGLSLFKMIVLQTMGKFDVTSEKNKGTKVKAELNTNHIDYPPLGDLVEMIYSIIINDNVKGFIYKHYYDENEFIFDLEELNMDKELLLDKTIRKEIRNYLDYNIRKIKNEVE